MPRLLWPVPWIRMEKEPREHKSRQAQRTKGARDTITNDAKEIGTVTVIVIVTGIANQVEEAKEGVL